MKDNSSLIEDYKSGKTIKELKLIYKMGGYTISKILKNAGLLAPKNIDKFKNLCDPNLQYWLGFISADGSIEYNKENRIYKVSLFSKDEEVIDAFLKFTGEIAKKYKRPTGIYEAAIHCKELCEYFINDLNIIPKKSLLLNPNIELTPAFILGYFDGDGCIVKSSKNRIRYECKITSGSKIFIDRVSFLLAEKEIFHRIRKKGNAYDIAIDRKNDSELFYNYLYSNNLDYCLKRKQDLFVALYGNIKITALGELLESDRKISSQAI